MSDIVYPANGAPEGEDIRFPPDAVFPVIGVGPQGPTGATGATGATGPTGPVNTNALPLTGGDLTGPLTITSASAAYVHITGTGSDWPAAAFNTTQTGTAAGFLQGSRSGLARWGMALGDTVTESGSNAGSDFRLGRYTDAGAFIDDAVVIARATGLMTVAGGGAFSTLSATDAVSGAGMTARFASPGAIGNTAASTGAFTTLSASSTVSGTGFSTYLASPPAIGATAPAAGSFTALSASGMQFTGSTFSIKQPTSTAEFMRYNDSGSALASYFNYRYVSGSNSLVMEPSGAAANLLIQGAGGGTVSIPTSTITTLTATQVNINASGPTIRAGTGAGTGTQPKGAIWLRTDGAVGSTLYVSQGGGTWNPVAGV